VTEQEPKPGEDCWACGYYLDRLHNGSGASDMERDAVLRELHNHRAKFHPGQDYGYKRL
jgi:hypothetical protein